MKSFATLLLAPLLLAAPALAHGPLVYEGSAGPGKGRHIVFLAGDHEYRSEETLPAMARLLAKHHGFKCTVLFNVDKDSGEIVPGNSNMPGLDALGSADLAVVFLRFQAFPAEQMKHFIAYLDRGGPVIGLRTATHAFKFPGDSPFTKYSTEYKGSDYELGFGHQVLGQTWVGHYGRNHQQSTRIDLIESKKSHAILRGVKDVWVQCGGYVGKPVSGDILTMAQPLNGMTPDSPADATKPPQPSEWTRTYTSSSGKTGRVFTSLYGASEDILNEGYRRMLVNACFWAAGMESAIRPDLHVGLVGAYNPTTFGGGRYRRGVKPSELAGWDSPIMPTTKPVNLPEKKAPKNAKAKKSAAAPAPAPVQQVAAAVRNATAKAAPAATPAAQPLDVICGPAALIAPVDLPLALKKGDHVVFIGNGLLEQMQEHGWFEAMLLQRFSTDDLVLRTLAWSADEVNLMPRPDEFGDLHQHLEAQKADVIVAAFGFNESFKGVAAVPQFERDLARLILALKTHKYNGRSAPRIVLVSPIAHENLGAPLPDSTASNTRLAAYTDAMARVAKACRTGFVDVFNPTRAAMQAAGKKSPLTYNGIHLTDAGYKVFAEDLFRGMFGETAPEPRADIKAGVEDKNRQFFRRYRALNAFYIYGGRAKPYGVVNFPEELKKFDELAANRDRHLWALAQGKASKLDDSNTTKLPAITGDRPINEWLKPDDQLKAFNVDPRFDVNLFASEDQFPDLAKPIQMRFDSRGRLWISCSTTYPQVTPGEEPADKIVILEDTNGDGRADKCSVFATGLHIPLSFELGDGGVYVSEQPHLMFLKDSDGDGKADVHRRVLTGFGTEDSHHSLHDITWSPEGDLIFREGIFHHSQVETPHGPVRARESSFFRYQPDTRRLTAFGSYRSTNPWGIAFDKWGWHLGSHPVFAAAVHSLNAPYPDIHISAGLYFPAYSGTCGQDFVASRHFPDELQDCFFRVRYKPVNTVEIHRWVEKDTHYEEERIGYVLQSSNLSFIPVDAQFGPRGDFYICDWYNPVKGHMQYSLRDTRRDKTSGRVWRVTAKGRPLLDAPKIEGAPVPALLDLLKAHESRTRYWARRELRERNHTDVKTALDAWVKRLDAKDKNLRHHQVEALWVYQSVRAENLPLLRDVLACDNHNARAAATRQLRWWHASLPDAVALLRQSANDRSGLVRLEAAMTASYFGLFEGSAPASGASGRRLADRNEGGEFSTRASKTAGGAPALPGSSAYAAAALEAALDVLKHPMDNYLTYALRTSLDSAPLKPLWNGNLAFDATRPQFAKFISTSARPEGVDGGKKGKAKKAAADPFDLLKPQVVTISCIPERMMFTVTEFKVKAGAPVKLILENPDATPHNLVICKPGTDDAIGNAANEMAKLPDAFEKMDFLPKSPNVLHATTMVLENKSDTLRFHAPMEPGKYPYICSFPGHYLVMRGVMMVE